MATRESRNLRSGEKEIITREKVPAGGGDEIDDSEPGFNPEREVIENFLDRFGEGARMVLVRQIQPNGDRAYMGRIDPGIMDEEYIKNHWGPGRYELRLLNDGGRFVAGSCTITIGGDMTRPAPAPASQGNGETSAIMELVKAQVESNARILAALLESQQRQGPSAERSEISEVVGALAAMKKLSSDMDPMKQFSMMLDVVKTASGMMSKEDGSNKPGWVYGMESIMEMAPKVLEQSMPTLARMQAAKANPDAAAPATPEAEAQQMFQFVVGMLKEKAKLNKPVEDIAYWAVNNLEEAQWQYVVSLINDPAALDRLAEMDPDIGKEPVKGWFSRLIRAMREEYATASNPDGAAGDTGDPGDDGPSRPRVNGGGSDEIDGDPVTNH